MHDPESIITINIHGTEFTFQNSVWTTNEPGLGLMIEVLHESTGHIMRHDTSLDCVRKALKTLDLPESCIVHDHAVPPPNEPGVWY